MLGARGHPQGVHGLPSANSNTGYIHLRGLFGNLEPPSLHAGFSVELASPSKVYERLVAATEVTRTSVRNEDRRSQ